MKAKTDTVYIDIFTDGSSFIGKNDYYEASSAVIICMGKQLLAEYGAFHRGGTNNYGETYAVRLALSVFNDTILPILEKKDIDFSVRIFSDSDFTIKSITSYSHGWYKAANKSFDAVWMNTKNEPVACQDNFKHIYRHFILNKPFKFDIYHIRGHVGEKIKLSEAYNKFIKKNDINISEIDFKYLVDMNHLCDKLAETIRTKKYTSYAAHYNNGVKKVNDDITEREKEK